MHQHRTAHRGFSLIELLVVLGIIAALSALLLPAVNKVRQQAITAECLSNMRQIGQGLNMYVGDANGWLPGPSFMGQMAVYTSSNEYLSRYLAQYLGYPRPSSKQVYCPLFACPGAAQVVDPKQYVVYILDAPKQYFGYPPFPGPANFRLPMRYAQVNNPATTIVISDVDAGNVVTAGWPRSYVPVHGMSNTNFVRNHLYFDGHAETLVHRN